MLTVIEGIDRPYRFGRCEEAFAPCVIVGRRRILVAGNRIAATAPPPFIKAGRGGRLLFNGGEFVKGVALGASNVEAMLVVVEIFFRIHKRTPMTAYLAFELRAEKNLISIEKNNVH